LNIDSQKGEVRKLLELIIADWEKPFSFAKR